MFQTNSTGKTAARGFTLIELSVVMVIIGLLSVAALNLYTTYNKQKVITTTSDNIKTAQAALQKYQDDHGFYPCPADPADPSGRATNCNDPVPAGSAIREYPGTAGRLVRIGAMPLYSPDGNTKLINGAQAFDGWRNRLTYAVTVDMAKSAEAFDSNLGGITVNKPDGGNLTTNGNILVLSHGESGDGAYNSNGVMVGSCATGTKDAENCNDDAVFVSGERSFAFGSNYNDDFVEFNTATAVETTKACPAGSILRGLKSNGDLICTKDLSCPAGSAFVGLLNDGETPNCQTVTSSCGPTEALVSMTLGAAPVCIRNMPGDCPVGYVQDGTISQEGPDFGKPKCIQILTACPANYVQVGTNDNHTPICVPNFNTKCPANMVQVGNNTDGSASCIAPNCPAGQYLYGVNGGSPMCSGDRTVNDGNCPSGQVVTGINGGAITCGAASMGGQIVGTAVVAGTHSTYITGKYGPFITLDEANAAIAYYNQFGWGQPIVANTNGFATFGCAGQWGAAQCSPLGYTLGFLNIVGTHAMTCSRGVPVLLSSFVTSSRYHYETGEGAGNPTVISEMSTLVACIVY